jgi:hypothetical protein
MSKFMRFSLLAPIVLAGFLCVSFPRGAVAVEPPVHADTALVLSAGSVTPSAYYYHGRRYPYRYHGMYYSHRYYRGGRYRYY